MLRSASYEAAVNSAGVDEDIDSSISDVNTEVPDTDREIVDVEKGQSNGLGRAMEGAGWLSRWVFLWITPLVARARHVVLQLGDLFDLPVRMEVEPLLERFERVWNAELEEKSARHASISTCLIRTFKWEIIIYTIVVTFMTVFMLMGPVYFVPSLIDYSATTNPTVGTGILLAFGLTLFEALRSLCAHQFWFRAISVAIDCRTIVFALLYKRAVSLRTLHGYSIGELVNICSNDGQRIFDAATNAAFLYIAILTSAGVLAYTVYVLGPAAISGWFILLFTLPFQAFVSRFIGRFRRKAIAFTDRRVRIMNEILSCIKLIKMYAWEESFAAQINGIRNGERRYLIYAGYLQSITVSMVPLIPVLAGMATFIIAAYAGRSLSSSNVFSVLASYNAFRFSLTVLPVFVKSASEASIGLKRLRQFITLEEQALNFTPPADSAIAVAFEDTTLSWMKLREAFRDGSRSSMGDCMSIVLRDISLKVPKGSCVGICGSVGAGKSSLLASLLGQLQLVGGSIHLSGSLCFVAQQAWIQSDTFRNNILFGQPFDLARYEMVLDACSLRHDLTILPAGDETEIGERGINLSGGQKQRISLARALYSNKDIYLLDDPLSAVDAHVGRHIFEHCIRGALRQKTVVFVTHQLQYLPECDHVVFIKDGAIAGQGSVASLCASVPEFRTLFETYGPTGASRDASAATKEPLAVEKAVSEPKAEVAAGKTLVRVEDRESGSVTLTTYAEYARAGGGIWLYSIVMLLFFLAACAKVFSDWWLSYWITQGSGDPLLPSSNPGSVADNSKLSFYALVYAMSAVFILLVQAIRGYMFTWLTLSSSSNLHNQVFRRMLAAPMAFFDTTPTGRILNRFSKDLDETDVQLPNVAEQFFQNTTNILASLGLIAYIFPYFLLSLVPISAFFITVVWYFWPCQREVKRVDNVTRSPMYSHLSATLQGLSTIHAFNKSKEFMLAFSRCLETNTKAFFAFFYVGRWFALRLDLTTTMMNAAVAFLVVGLTGSINPSLAGLCLMYVNSLGGLFQYSTRLSAELEARMTSVERIHYYARQVASEAAFVSPQDPPPHTWPLSGEIIFKDFSVRYRENLPTVLKNVSFRVLPKEKIGIVGRTGSGKSSICLALFRLMEPSGGQIIIDEIDICTIGLRALRAGLSIIPQDPLMFVGTLRYNLDPFNEHSDVAVWQAIDQAHLRSTVMGLPAQLDTNIVENGENLSVGERQLVCMARALLRDSHILVLDEATAAVDVHTDAAIQETIRQAFRNCTVLTVAHRLNTVLDCDRIMVLEDGHIKEFDTPTNLLADTQSALAAMVRTATGAVNTDVTV